jgi:hypothetical protein
MRITLKQLQKHGACIAQTNTFAELFGNGGVVTEERVAQAADHGLHLTWALKLLDQPMKDEFWRLRRIVDGQWLERFSNYALDGGQLRAWYNKMTGTCLMCVILKREAGLL